MLWAITMILRQGSRSLVGERYEHMLFLPFSQQEQWAGEQWGSNDLYIKLRCKMASWRLSEIRLWAGMKYARKIANASFKNRAIVWQQAPDITIYLAKKWSGEFHSANIWPTLLVFINSGETFHKIYLHLCRQALEIRIFPAECSQVNPHCDI